MNHISVAINSAHVAASPTVIQVLPSILATLSLIVAAVTLFRTHLNAAKIVVHPGSVVELAYDQEGHADLVRPATFINVSNRTAVVRYAAVTLRRVDGSQVEHLMQART